ncbi:MAG: hypothetical protein AAGM45_10690 [Cyanobacteria bacterium J06588_5]
MSDNCSSAVKHSIFDGDAQSIGRLSSVTGYEIDDENGIFSHANDGYTPDIRFQQFSNLDDLLQSRLPALAGETPRA